MSLLLFLIVYFTLLFNSLGAKASFEIRLVSTACDDSLLGDYFSYALDSLKVSHFSIYSLFSNLKVEISNNSIFC